MFSSVFFPTSVDVVLPCPACIAIDNGLSVEEWREARMNSDHLKTKMQCRLRQHLSRVHGLKARDKEAVKLREFGKELLCPFLHTREKESSSEVLFKLILVIKHFFCQ